MSAAHARPRGRPAGATRADVLAAATHGYLRGRRIDVQAIAADLGIGRATIYRWYGSREGLVGEVLVAQALELLQRARADARGRGAAALVDTFDRVNRALAAAPALHSFLEQERDAALRTITSSAGPVQPRMVAAIAQLIEEEARESGYVPPVEPATMAYAIVRLAEAFIYNDAVVGIRGAVDRLRELEAALLGVPPAGRVARG